MSDSTTVGDAIYRITRLIGTKSLEELAAIERFVIQQQPLSTRGDAVTDLIDRYEAHKAAVEERSDLRIVARTIAIDYDDGIRMLNYLRNLLLTQKQVDVMRMKTLSDRLREMAADTEKLDGSTMLTWDQIRGQVERLPGSDLPRLNFESLMENFAEIMREAADNIDALNKLTPHPTIPGR